MKNCYNIEKLWHYTDTINKLPELKKPVHVRIYPTNKCNHNCEYCTYKNPNLGLGGLYDRNDSIPYDKMVEIINNLSQLGCKAVTISGGGEPLLYPKIRETLQLFKYYNIPVGLYTNGSLLKGDLARWVKSHVSWVRISIDGHDNESYSKIRGVSLGEFDKVIQNMKEYQDLPGKGRLAVAVNIIRKGNKYFDIDLKKKLESIGIERIQYRFVDEDKDDLRGPEKTYDWCPISLISPVIGADLKIWSCCDKAYNDDVGIMGDLNYNTLIDWYNESHSLLNPCLDCKHKCLGHDKNVRIFRYLEAEDKGFI